MQVLPGQYLVMRFEAEGESFLSEAPIRPNGLTMKEALNIVLDMGYPGAGKVYAVYVVDLKKGTVEDITSALNTFVTAFSEESDYHTPVPPWLDWS